MSHLFGGGIGVTQVFFVALGALVAVLISAIAEVLRAGVTGRRSREHFRQMLRQELPEVTAIVERLAAEAMLSGGVIPIARLDELETALRGLYDRHAEPGAALNNTLLRREVKSFLRNVSLAASSARTVESLATHAMARHDSSLNAFFADRRQQSLQELRRLSEQTRGLCDRAEELR